MKTIKLVALAGIAGLLAACAQQEEMTMVSPEPVFDKYGGGSCEEGYIYIPGTAPQPPQCVPEDECEMVTVADGSVICPPPPPERDRDDSDEGRDPIGSAPTRG